MGQASFSYVVAVVFLAFSLASGARLVRAESSASEYPHKNKKLQSAEQLVQKTSGGRLHVRNLFPGPDGLIGVIVQAEGETAEETVVWMLPNGEAIMTGTLFDGAGHDLNRASLERLGLRFGPSESLQRASSPLAGGIVVGSHGPTLTIFMDPNCSYCHLLYQRLMPEVLKGAIKIRFVMVGVIKADSQARAAAILSAAVPLSALEQDQDGFDDAAEEGGFPITATKLSAAAAAAVKANNILMSKTGIDGTPALLYCSKTRADVELTIGIPQALETLLADLSQRPARACAN